MRTETGTKKMFILDTLFPLRTKSDSCCIFVVHYHHPNINTHTSLAERSRWTDDVSPLKVTLFGANGPYKLRMNVCPCTPCTAGQWSFSGRRTKEKTTATTTPTKNKSVVNSVLFVSGDNCGMFSLRIH